MKTGIMEKIITKEKNVVVRFNSYFYPKEMIIEGIKNFESLCSAEITDDEFEIVVILAPKTEKMDLNMIGYEFYNHILELIKNKR